MEYKAWRINYNWDTFNEFYDKCNYIHDKYDIDISSNNKTICFEYVVKNFNNIYLYNSIYMLELINKYKTFDKGLKSRETGFYIDKDVYDTFISITEKLMIKKNLCVTAVIHIFINNTDLFIKNTLEQKSTFNPLIANFPQEILNYKLNNTIEKDIKEQLKNIFPVKRESKIFKTKEDINYVFVNIYKMLYIFKCTSGEIYDCFQNVDKRTVLSWLKKVNWKLSREEVQSRAAKKRNYKQIRNKGRQTMLKKNVCGVSTPEEYTRQKLNTYLPQVFDKAQIIVGLNNISILQDGKEIDIPIIIFYNDKMYKLAVEYNGGYWHRDIKRDLEKQNLIKKDNYKLFYIQPIRNNLTGDQLKMYINNKITDISMEIKNIIKYTS